MKNQFRFEQAEDVYRELENFTDPPLIDVRSNGEFADGHARGSVSIPLDELDREIVEHKFGHAEIQRKSIYLMCQSGVRAEQAAYKLHQMGLHDLVIVKGGFDEWRSMNLPVARTSRLPSLERQTQIALGSLLLIILFKGLVVHPIFYALIGFLGIGLITAGVTARCTLTALLARMPWNQQKGGSPA